MNTAKFELGDLLGIGMTLVVLGIGLAYGMDVLNDTRGDLCDGTLDNYYKEHCYTCPAGNTTWIPGNLSCAPAAAGTSVVVGTNEGTAFNASTDAMTGVAKLPEKLPTIVTVIVAAVIIGILVRYLWKGVVGGQ